MFGVARCARQMSGTCWRGRRVAGGLDSAAQSPWLRRSVIWLASTVNRSMLKWKRLVPSAPAASPAAGPHTAECDERERAVARFLADIGAEPRRETGMADPQGPLTGPELDEEIGRLAEEVPEPEPGCASQLLADPDAQSRPMR